MNGGDGGGGGGDAGGSGNSRDDGDDGGDNGGGSGIHQFKFIFVFASGYTYIRSCSIFVHTIMSISMRLLVRSYHNHAAAVAKHSAFFPLSDRGLHCRSTRG